MKLCQGVILTLGLIGPFTYSSVGFAQPVAGSLAARSETTIAITAVSPARISVRAERPGDSSAARGVAGLLNLCVATNAPGATYSIRVIDSSVDSISAAHPVRLEGSARSGQLDGQATGLAPRLAVSGLSAAKTLKACRAANPATARLLVKGGAPLSAGPAPSADVLTLIIGLD